MHKCFFVCCVVDQQRAWASETERGAAQREKLVLLLLPAVVDRRQTKSWAGGWVMGGYTVHFPAARAPQQLGGAFFSVF